MESLEIRTERTFVNTKHKVTLPSHDHLQFFSLFCITVLNTSFFHFQQMAAALSPCRCSKTRVLHFRVKNTPLKDKKWKEKVQKNAQLSFCGGREAFHQEIVLRGIQPCFLLDGAHRLFWNATKEVKFLLNFQVHFALYGQDNYVFEREFMYF